MILLASASPRRAEILQRHGVEFIQDPTNIDESHQTDEPAQAYVVRLAREKAQDRLHKLESSGCILALAADTCVAIDKDILGKPQNFEDYMAMMQRLSGRVHEVHSAVAAINESRAVETVSVTTKVSFREIASSEAKSYWQSGEPADKAGGYGIQGLAAEFVERIEGSYSNVVGLPILETLGLLNRWGVGSYLNKTGV